MLQRGNSDAAVRLRRAKSTTSVPRVPKCVASTALGSDRNNALTAATLAFERAQALEKLEGRSSGDVVARSQSVRTPRRSIEKPRLSRQISRSKRMSFRDSTFRDANRTERPKHDVRKTKSSVQLTPASHKAPSYISSGPCQTPETRTNTPWEEIQFAERFDGYGRSTKARLRKTQSSCAWLHSPDNHPLATEPSESIPLSRMTYGKQLTVPRPSMRENQTDEAIIALARDKYLQEHQPIPLTSKRSSITASIRSRFRKADPSSIQSSDMLTRQNNSIEISELGSKATEGSETAPKTQKHEKALAIIKKGLRKAFRKSSKSDFRLPPQQLEATRVHYRETINDTEQDPFLDARIPSDAIGAQDWFQERPPTPPPHRIGNFTSIAQGNAESCNSDDLDVPYIKSIHFDRSRVTSWNDSTRQSTLMMRDIGHLPIIQEKSDAIETTPIMTRKKMKPSASDITMRESSATLKPKESVDSRRLISALMKHAKFKRGETELQERHPDNDLNRVFQNSHMKDPMQPSSSNASHKSREQISDPCPYEEHDAPFDRADVVSPSVYSEVHDSQMAPQISRPSSPPGFATVMAPEAVGRWHVGRTHERGRSSSEWRNWAADEAAGLISPEDFTLPILNPKIKTSSSVDRFDTESGLKGNISSESKGSMTRKQSSQSQGSRRPSKQHSLMNDRFPMLRTGRTLSKGSLIYSRHTSDTIGHSTQNKDHLLTTESDDRKKDSRGAQRQQTDVQPVASSNRNPKVGKVTPDSIKLGEDKSIKSLSTESESRAKYSNNASGEILTRGRTQCTDRGSPLVRRGAHNLDDNFLLRIRRGPYGASSSSLAKANTNSLDSIRLPKRQSPALSSTSKENSPPTKGQQMTNEFLKSRSNKSLNRGDSSSPAFL